MISGREEDRPRDLRAASRDVVLGQRLVRLRLAPPQDRLHHHDRAVDDDAEVDRAERQQVRRDVA